MMDFSLKSVASTTAATNQANKKNKEEEEEEKDRRERCALDGHLQLQWAAIVKARERIEALRNVIGPLSSLNILQESEWPARLLLKDASTGEAVISHISSANSGHGKDPLCQWLYDTFQTKDPDLQDVVLRYIPAICGIYLLRITTHGHDSLAGFEAVLLALYTSETKDRKGHPLIISIPELSHPSLYHTPRIPSTNAWEPSLGLISPSLEPQEAVKATKRACIIGVALNLFLSRIAVMPAKAKIEACQSAFRWASGEAGGTKAAVNRSEVDTLNPSYCLNTSIQCKNLSEIAIDRPGEVSGNIEHLIDHTKACKLSDIRNKSSPSAQTSNEAGLFDNNPPAQHGKSCESDGKSVMQPSRSGSGMLSESKDAAEFMRQLMQAGNGAQIQLQWEFLQPMIRILGHCLMAPFNSDEVRSVASLTTQALHHRVSHDLIPEAILATHSLMRLDTASKTMVKTLSISEKPSSSSSKPQKLKNLLVPK